MRIRFWCFKAALSTTSLPVKLVDTDSTVDCKIVLTPSAAAMCRTRSDFDTNFSTNDVSLMSPW